MSGTAEDDGQRGAGAGLITPFRCHRGEGSWTDAGDSQHFHGGDRTPSHHSIPFLNTLFAVGTIIFPLDTLLSNVFSFSYHANAGLTNLRLELKTGAHMIASRPRVAGRELAGGRSPGARSLATGQASCGGGRS